MSYQLGFIPLIQSWFNITYIYIFNYHLNSMKTLNIKTTTVKNYKSLRENKVDTNREMLYVHESRDSLLPEKCHSPLNLPIN